VLSLNRNWTHVPAESARWSEVSVTLRKMEAVCLDAVAQTAEVMAFPASRAESDRQAKIAELRRELYRDLLSGGNAVDIASASEASLAARYYELGVAHAAAVIEHGALLTGYPAPGSVRLT